MDDQERQEVPTEQVFDNPRVQGALDAHRETLREINGEPQRRFFSREAVQQADDIKREWVDVPEWGGGCWVRGLTALEQSKLERTGMTEDGKVNPLGYDYFRIRQVLVAAVDDDNKPIFTNADIRMLEKKSIQAVERIADVASRLSGMSKKDVEALTGKSATTPNGDSPSASPSIWDTPPPT